MIVFRHQEYVIVGDSYDFVQTAPFVGIDLLEEQTFGFVEYDEFDFVEVGFFQLHFNHFFVVA